MYGPVKPAIPGGDVGGESVRDIPIAGTSIPLGSFLKWGQSVGSGGEAKQLVQGGKVTVNGQVETRRRRELLPGDIVGLPGGVRLRVGGGGSPH